jgi:Tol biopolymer transport system component/DNA-binding winged helix-turn-helix (wHTH) protein
MKDEPQSGTLIEFGPFTFDKTLGKLSKHGTPVRLRGMPLKILHHLVEHPGEVVSRADLQQVLWNGAAFGDFEQGLNSAVNVVRKTLSDSADQPRYIETVPGHGYRFIAPLRSCAPVPEAHTCIQHPDDAKLALEHLKDSTSVERSPSLLQRQWPRRRGVLVPGLGILLLSGIFTWRTRLWMPQRNPSTEPLRALPLTTALGVHRYPSFSPDGNYLTFTWAAPKQHTSNVYVQQIGGGSPLQLTTSSNDDYSPVWSPDGRFIAFLRRSEGGISELRVIPPLGGPERKLSEVRPRIAFLPVSLAWCPDSNCIVVTDSTGDGKPDALFVYSLETREKIQLTYPPGSSAGDTSPAISPDGNSMVFRRDASLYTGELYWLPLAHAPVSQASGTRACLTAAGEPRRLTPAALDAGTPTFLPDGEEILFSARGGLWRLRVAPEERKGVPARLPFVGEDGIMPVVSRPQPGRPLRLVYVRSFADWNIWRVDSSAPGAAASSPPALSIASTRVEWMPDFSSDGRRVTFVSNRSGEAEIWVADPDGSNASQVTSMSANPGAPRWSPNGELIAFHSNPEGHAAVYVVPSAGGKARNITFPLANGGFPSFSRDGRWIYFTSHGAGGEHIWKVPVSGGDAVQVTKNQGVVAFESPDGTYIYYVQTIDRPSALWRLPVSGGDPVKVLDEVVSANFVVLDRGIYYMSQSAGEIRLQYFEFATRKSKIVLSNLGNVFLASLTASPDGRTILYARVDSSVDDVMLVESFR